MNVKGVIFFSAPHYGSDIVTNIGKMGWKRFNLFETTSTEYGNASDKIARELADLYVNYF